MEFIARQPIFDRQRKLAASELLFRNSEENRCCVPDLNVASRQMMATAMLVGLRMRDCLDLVIAYERGELEVCDRHGEGWRIPMPFVSGKVPGSREMAPITPARLKLAAAVRQNDRQ